MPSVKRSLHDWTLISITLHWESGKLTAEFRGADSAIRLLIAKDVCDLKVPRTYPWGSSVSVNGISLVSETSAERKSLTIEMQSGDVIEISAADFELP
jgi:hypothetical protein